MNNTKISWTDQTANPIRARNKQNGKRGWHCVKVSPGCASCYAERMNRGPYGNGLPFREDVRADVELYLEYSVLDKLEKQRTGKKTFLCDMTDLFQKNVPLEWIAKIWATMAVSRNTFQILTKRAERMFQVLTSQDFLYLFKQSLEVNTIWSASISLPLKNVWLGVSCEDQKNANERIPLLLQTPAAIRFLSLEPLLDWIDLAKPFTPDDDDWDSVNELQAGSDDDHAPEEWVEENELEGDWINFGSDLVRNPEYVEWHNWRVRRAKLFAFERSIDWVIVGGESGPNFRPMNLEWARLIRDDCIAANVAFFFKQQSAFRSETNPLLDGVEWHQFPDAKGS